MCKEIYEKNEKQESSDTLPFHWEFGKEEITLKVSSYAYGNGLAVLMYSQREGQSGICDRENPNPSICSELWIFADRYGHANGGGYPCNDTECGVSFTGDRTCDQACAASCMGLWRKPYGC